MCKMWEFKDDNGFKWIISESEDNIKMEVVTFSSLIEDWKLIDKLKEQGKLKFVREYVGD